MSTVLVVDDEPIVREVVVSYLRREGYRTLEAGDGQEARRLLEQGDPGLVVLDLMLPGIDGLQLCRWIRSRSDVPVIMLTARGEETDRIVGLELGADDYVTKPFSPRELAARVRAVLRRADGTGEGAERRLEFGDVTIEASTREATKDGSPLALTAREFDLLWFLASHPRRVFSREQLMDRVWGYRDYAGGRVVDSHVARIRRKLGEDGVEPRFIKTIHGVGYAFQDQGGVG